MEISRLRRHLIAAVLAMLLILVIVLVRSPPANAIWMKEGQIVKLKNVYEGKSMVTSVEFIDIGGSGNRTKLCGFLIDGDQLWVEEGNDRELKGGRVYVRDAISVRDQLQDKDVCKVIFSRPILEMNKSMEQETEKLVNESMAIENKSMEERIDGVEEEAIPPEEAAEEAIVEQPARINIFARIILWLRNLFY